MSALPAVFGVQQILEGFVWVGIGRGDPALARAASLGFLFFAMVFWPFWIPWSARCLEKRRLLRGALGFTALGGLAAALAVYLPLATHAPEALSTSVLHHSIRYEIGLPPMLSYIPLALWQAGYLALVTIPLFVAGDGRFRVFGLLLLMSAAASQVAYGYAFISVWCAFAAVLSAWLCGTLALRDDPPVPSPSRSRPARQVP